MWMRAKNFCWLQLLQFQPKNWLPLLSVAMLHVPQATLLDWTANQMLIQQKCICIFNHKKLLDFNLELIQAVNLISLTHFGV